MEAILDLPCPSVILWLSFCNAFWWIFVTFLSNREAYKVGTWCTHGQWVDVSCTAKTGCCCLFVPFFLHVSFSPIFNHLNISSHFSHDLWVLQSWNLVHTCTVGGCTVFLVIRLLLLIRPFISSCFFLSNFQCHSVILSICNAFKWNLGHIFLSKREVYKVETWYTCGQWVDVTCILEIGCCWLFVPFVLHLSFYQIFKH